MSAWRYIHASEKGSGHDTTGQPCQDNHAIKVMENGQDEPLLLVVTSDGAGSAAHSEEGSAAVCDETPRWLEMRLSNGTAFLTEADGMGLVHNLRNFLLNYAEEPERQYAVRDLACTLNAAAVLPEQAWFVQVGDGATIIQSLGSEMEVVFWPDSGEYANQTYFITDVPENHIHTRLLEGNIDRLSVMTDGLQSLALAMQQRSAHAPFFESMFKGVESLDGVGTEAHLQLQGGLSRFLNSPGVNARTSDDKTLVLASRRPQTDSEVQPSTPAPEVEEVPAPHEETTA